MMSDKALLLTSNNRHVPHIEYHIAHHIEGHKVTNPPITTSYSFSFRQQILSNNWYIAYLPNYNGVIQAQSIRISKRAYFRLHNLHLFKTMAQLKISMECKMLSTWTIFKSCYNGREIMTGLRGGQVASCPGSKSPE